MNKFANKNSAHIFHKNKASVFSGGSLVFIMIFSF